MENNCAKIVVDALIIGGGFKGMMTAYGLIKQGQTVCIVDNAKQLGGFMAPMKWQGVDMDKGPQYLDGVNAEQKAILDDIMSDHQPLTTLEFSCFSYWNGHTSEGFAIPDYRTLDKTQRALILYEAINAKPQVADLACIADGFNDDNLTSSGYLTAWCEKFINHHPRDLSPLNQNFVTFFGRKLVLNNDLSIDLKQHPLLDDAIAANKRQVDHNTYNLYPQGKTLGYFREAFEHKLNKMGVQTLLGATVMAVNNDNNGYRVEVAKVEGADICQQVAAKAVYCAGTVESSEKLLLGSEQLKAKIKPVSQLFYLIELEQPLDLPFYIMNYSNDSLARVTYFNAYAQKSSNGKPIICVEVPAAKGCSLWNNPDAHYPILCKELKGMGIDGFGEYKVELVPSTYRLLLKGYEVTLAAMKQQVKTRYGDAVHILTPHLLTRASIMHDLSECGILSVTAD